ncbi:hypothetical protein RF11_03412 [Thelohanellus kitauei]|uniref:Uncharacterized protein n=1 Tax=Thelohanellus kitauei TaxID=669202 RepID=A0A0C2NJV9_THEKT|nr:hypothetical protein RF11_03412 [Thelohanellus kitauei]
MDILSACQEMVRIIFGEADASDVNKIPLPDRSIHRRIVDRRSDIELNIVSKIKSREFFALQVDKNTEISGKAELYGAFTITGRDQGFFSLSQQQNRNIIVTHCFLQSEAPADETVGPEL